MKKVLIVGSGAQGNVICGVLSEAEDVGKIVIGDINPERAREVAEYIGNSKVAAERIDASNLKAMERRMCEEEGGFDLVVNATLPMFNRQIIQAACRARVNYLDMASYEFFPKEGVLLDELEYEQEWNEAGLKALISAGGDPDSEMWKFLIQGLGLMDDKPIEVKGCKISPRDLLFQLIPPTLSPQQMIKLVKEKRIMSRLMLAVDVVGKKGDRKLYYTLWSDSPNSVEACEWIPGTNDVSWLTSIPASIFSLMLLRDQVGHTGIFPPEVFNREERTIFFNGIKEWGVKVHKQVQEII